MLYFRESGATVQQYCKNCQFTRNLESAAALKISTSLYAEDDLLYAQYKNKYLRFDPTLPRVKDPNIVCPSADCSGPKDDPQVLYIKYHPVHMKYLYCCDYCGYMWRGTQ
jgi:hypothetical protein